MFPTICECLLCWSFYELCKQRNVNINNNFFFAFFTFSFILYLQNNEKQMRQLSVIPPMMFDAEQRRVKFINMNGLMEDPMKVYKDRQFMNVWTDHEKEIFKEK